MNSGANAEAAMDVYWSGIRIPDRGYVWIEDATPAAGGVPPQRGVSPFLVMHPETKWTERVNLLERETALYKKFAALEPARARILEFANEFGWLGIDELYHSDQTGLVSAEGLNLWQEEIREMAIAVWLLNRISETDRSTNYPKDKQVKEQHTADLKKAFIWERGAVIMSISMSGCKVIPGYVAMGKGRTSFTQKKNIAGPGHRENEMQSWKQGDVFGPARLDLLSRLNSKLKGGASPQLFIDARGGYEGRIAPHNLLTTMWLQLYQELIGQTRVRQCVVCHGWMDVTQSRSTKRMHDACSKSRRMRSWQSKQKDAAGKLAAE